jgi:GNAT superfamily N-acetyltransferase
MHIQVAESDNELQACFIVMAELRPDLVPDEFVARVRRQEREGFRLAYLKDGDDVMAVAGFRLMEKLFTGPAMYVDDLVTKHGARSRGYGHALFRWLIAHARTQGCRALELDSGVQRFDAHRFYLRERMAIQSHHFVLEL